MVVRPPMSGECRYPCVPNDIPCDVTRLKVEITCRRPLPETSVSDFNHSKGSLSPFLPRPFPFLPQAACASVPRDARHRRPICFPLRRACPGVMRLGSGADPDPVPRSSAGDWPDLPVRVPRPGRGFEHLGPHGRDPCRPHHRGGGDQSVPSCAPAFPFAGSFGCGVDAGVTRAGSVTRGLAETTARSRGPAPWLHVFKPLRPCDRQAPARHSVTPTRRERSPDSLPPMGRNGPGGYSGAWLCGVSKAGSKTK